MEIRDGSELWGLSVSETADAVRTVTGDSGAETALHRHRRRTARRRVLRDDRPAHALAWGGSGAVMGYKNLKAVAASGREIPKAADGDAFLAESRRYSWVLRASSASAALRAGGTHGMAGVGGWSGKVPTSVRNLQEEFWDGEKSARISEAAFHPWRRSGPPAGTALSPASISTKRNGTERGSRWRACMRTRSGGWGPTSTWTILPPFWRPTGSATSPALTWTA